MNVLITESAPEGTFEEVSIELDGWRERFELLVSERKQIRFNVHTMPIISEHVRDSLNRHKYVYVIEESHADQLFLVPIGSKVD
jgi:hypothetical protein